MLSLKSQKQHRYTSTKITNLFYFAAFTCFITLLIFLYLTRPAILEFTYVRNSCEGVRYDYLHSMYPSSDAFLALLKTLSSSATIKLPKLEKDFLLFHDILCARLASCRSCVKKWNKTSPFLSVLLVPRRFRGGTRTAACSPGLHLVVDAK